jgi:hypothetical protein
MYIKNDLFLKRQPELKFLYLRFITSFAQVSNIEILPIKSWYSIIDLFPVKD